MTFKLFIYYSALCGGWAAFLTWVIVVPAGLHTADPFVVAIVLGGLLGMLVAAAVGVVDAILNSSGAQRMVRALVCAGIGLVGGLLGSAIGQLLAMARLPVFIGWILVGIGIGSSVGLYDFIQAKGDRRQSFRKVLNGIYGGLLGGFIGGLLFGLLRNIGALSQTTVLAFGLVILGLCIGLMIGLAQVFLKEAWLQIEQGRRIGKQLILSKEETTIGRAESCDLGLFGEKEVERLHARIRLQQNAYLIEDEGTPSGTFVNDQKVKEPTRLHAGDVIRIGSCALRFGERQK